MRERDQKAQINIVLRRRNIKYSCLIGCLVVYMLGWGEMMNIIIDDETHRCDELSFGCCQYSIDTTTHHNFRFL
jgi:hypothetical protein